MFVHCAVILKFSVSYLGVVFMSVAQDVLVTRGLLQVVARKLQQDQGDFRAGERVYDVVIDGQEVLHTFSSLNEAAQFLDMISPLSEQSH